MKYQHCTLHCTLHWHSLDLCLFTVAWLWLWALVVKYNQRSWNAEELHHLIWQWPESPSPMWPQHTRWWISPGSLEGRQRRFSSLISWPAVWPKTCGQYYSDNNSLENISNLDPDSCSQTVYWTVSNCTEESWPCYVLSTSLYTYHHLHHLLLWEGGISQL